MRTKDIEFIADVLNREREHVEAREMGGLLAATSAIRLSIVERQPDADVSALDEVEDALAGRMYGICRICGEDTSDYSGDASDYTYYGDRLCGACRDSAIPVADEPPF